MTSLDNHSSEPVRLNKFLASCGIGSRRKCDELIQAGEVVVNGKVVKDMSLKVDHEDFVKINNKRVQPLQTMTILFHKPRGCVCTKNDELERETIYDHLPPSLHHPRPTHRAYGSTSHAALERPCRDPVT